MNQWRDSFMAVVRCPYPALVGLWLAVVAGALAGRI